jgi:hypothetical protein
MNEIDLTDIYRTFHLMAEDYMSLSAAHEPSPK